MALDFEEDGIHFVNVNYGLEDFIHVIKIKFNSFVEQFTVQIIGPVGWYVFELVFNTELLSPGDLAVFKGAFMQERTSCEYSVGEEFH